MIYVTLPSFSGQNRTKRHFRPSDFNFGNSLQKTLAIKADVVFYLLLPYVESGFFKTVRIFKGLQNHLQITICT